MSELFRNIEARTRLAGTNKLEILLFSLGVDARTGRRETFGLNVFKVREVLKAPPVTAAPDMPGVVEGMVSMRGILVPVIHLGRYTGIHPETPPDVMIITEYNGHTQGFLVEAVDTILRLDWGSMRVPPDMLSGHMTGLVTAVTELADGRLVMMLDVEKILAETAPPQDETVFQSIRPVSEAHGIVYFADDSAVARQQIARTLDAMQVRYRSAINGLKAWDDLQRLADHAELLGEPVENHVRVILTDIEMPEMDGYMLTRRVKSDPRFRKVPVLMHSSLSSSSNERLGLAVGVDAYVPKFEPHRLAETIAGLLAEAA
ncbi:MAG: chemotaxis protein CheV [Rhodocyclaceae bacterium]|nr:chemotaxis protein CheV [Rhodocyclaceae bacterium]